MQSSMQQQPVQPQHYPGEAYRGTPNGQGPTALPPIHHFEGMQPQQQYAAINGAQLQHPQPYNPNQYQYQTNGAMQPAPMPSNGQNGVLRFPIAPQAPLDARSMSGGRHKKEIKRRTKTGCLTCRKRRIKVSEYCVDIVVAKSRQKTRSSHGSAASSESLAASETWSRRLQQSNC